MLGILGFVAIIVFTIQVYRSAKSTERNAPLWAAICAVLGLGLQIVMPIAVGIVLGVYYVLTGTPVEEIAANIQGPATIIGFLGLGTSIIGMVLVAKHVSKVKDDDPTSKAPPPPPPTFGQDPPPDASPSSPVYDRDL